MKKWHERAYLTHKYKHVLQLMAHKKRMIYKKACFLQLKERFYIDASYMQGVSNLAAKLDNKLKHNAFDMIYWFIRSKDACYQQEK